ncbi:hypothetical protein C8F01DRAFT_1094915 [Mycena amicta]|nr:hypothetical protein C8F01DRAFT_1094915 [Mycena amicta]
MFLTTRLAFASLFRSSSDLLRSSTGTFRLVSGQGSTHTLTLLWCLRSFRLHPLPVADEDALRVMQELIFDWNYVVPMARFIAVVVRNWRWFKNVMPTMVSEDDPGLDDGDMADVFVKFSLRWAVEVTQQLPHHLNHMIVLVVEARQLAFGQVGFAIRQSSHGDGYLGQVEELWAESRHGRTEVGKKRGRR